MGLTLVQITDDYVSKNGSKSQATRNTALNSFKRIEKVIGKNMDDITLKDLRNPEKVVSELLDTFSVNTVIQTLLYMKYLIKTLTHKETLLNQYQDFLSELIDERNQEFKQGKKTPAEEKLGDDFDWITMRDKFIKHLNEKGLKDSFSSARSNLLLALYLLQPPTRISNYLNMKVKQPSKKLKPDTNFLLRDDEGFKFVFQKYKTAKHIGKVMLPVKNKDLEGLIKNYLGYHPEYKKGSKRAVEFLVNNSGKPMTQSNFTQVLKNISEKVFGVPLSVNNFRHSFATWFQQQNPTVIEKERIGKILGHKDTSSRADHYVRHDEDKKSALPEFDDL